MESLRLQRDFFKRLFPFFVQVDKTMTILDCGESLLQLLPNVLQSNFNAHFSLIAPSKVIRNFSSLTNLANASTTLQLKSKTTVFLHGQFEYLVTDEQMVFLGSPCANPNERMRDLPFGLDDPAIQDHLSTRLPSDKPLEVTTTELNELLHTIDKQKHDLDKSEERLSVLSQIAEDNINAVIITDALNRITWANKSFSMMTGYSASEYIGKNPAHLLQGPNTDPETADYLKFQVKNIQNFNGEILNYTKDGSEYWVRISGQPLFNKQNELTGFFAIEQDITRERIIQEQLLDSERKLRVSLEKVGDNVWEHDFRTHTTTFSKINNEFIEMEEAGANSADLWWSRIYKDDLHLLDENDRKLRSGEVDSHNLKYRMVQNDGSVRWVLDRGVVIEKDSRGLPLKIIGTHTNITEQKQLEELLIKAKEEALELAKTKELFLANMSHEIRTPLNAIIGMVRELKHTALDSTQMQLVKNADASSDHLFSLVNNVLDLSKIDSGNFELDKSVFCWNELLEKVNAVTQKSASDKQLELTFENRVQVNEQFVGDAGRIRQVLFNVIGNAIKFTEKGHVLMQCKNGKTVDHQRELIVSISDTGIGMDPTFLASIFDKFTQENNSIQRKYGGTGLGMSITKQLVERMGGRIEVDSELGGGTRFVIYFMLEQADPLAATMDVDLKTDVSLTGKKILVVEDNEMNRLVAKSLLARHHAEVLFAENGLVAIDQVKLHRFDLILMDLQMPVMDGLEAAAQIRKMKINTPIIAFTANAFKTEIDNALRAGMDDFVAKPFDERTLLEKMKGALSKGKTGGLAITKEDTSDEQENISACIDEAYMDEISGGSAAFRKEMFKIFHKQSHEFLDQSADLIIQQKWADLIRVAHQFKPQGSYLGAKELTQIVARIEKECKLGPNISALKNDLGAATEMIKKINREIEVKLNLVQ